MDIDKLNALINYGQGEIREIINYLYIYNSSFSNKRVGKEHPDVLKRKQKLEDWRSEVIYLVKDYLDPNIKKQLVQSFSMLETTYELIYFSEIITILQKTKIKVQHELEDKAHMEKAKAQLEEAQKAKALAEEVKALTEEAKEVGKSGAKIKAKINNSKVFIVHGHDELMIAQLESFLQKLGLEPIILREQANEGQTIIEKLESNSNVKYAIVLYTACDFGCPKEDVKLANRLKPRARQNVVFEHGFFISKLGRKNVCALLEDGVEEPGDITGVLYIPIDKNGAWKLRVAKEMKNVGLNVDLNKL